MSTKTSEGTESDDTKPSPFPRDDWTVSHSVDFELAPDYRTSIHCVAVPADAAVISFINDMHEVDANRQFERDVLGAFFEHREDVEAGLFMVELPRTEVRYFLSPTERPRTVADFESIVSMMVGAGRFAHLGLRILETDQDYHDLITVTERAEALHSFPVPTFQSPPKQFQTLGNLLSGTASTAFFGKAVSTGDPTMVVLTAVGIFAVWFGKPIAEVARNSAVDRLSARIKYQPPTEQAEPKPAKAAKKLKKVKMTGKPTKSKAEVQKGGKRRKQTRG